MDGLIREAEDANTTSKSSSAVRKKDGQLITEQNEVLKRWEQHFELMLNQEQPINPVKIHEECNPVLTELRQDQ